MEALGAQTLAALARALDVTPQAINAALRRKQIPTKWVFQVSQKTGRSFEWLATGQEGPATQMFKDLAYRMEAIAATNKVARQVQELLLEMPITKLPLTAAALQFIKEAPEEDQQAVRRLLLCLRTGSSKTHQLVAAQLKAMLDTIELVEQEHKGGRSEAAGARTKAAG